MTFPPVGVTAVIAGMAVFNRDAAIVENRLRSIQREALRLEATSAAGASGAARAFTQMANTVTTAATVIAGAVALAGVASIKFAADFEQSLALTEALTDANADQMKRLETTIIQLTRTGTLGMTELNQAATELARAGVPIEDVMNGALKAVQDLTIASGGEIGLQAAAKLVSTSMNAFGLSVEEVDRVTTAATVVAQNSALTFTDFGLGVQYSAPGFQAAGFSIEDLALATALLGKNGVTGSVAATSLRGVIQRLIRPSEDAKKVMEQYGISLFDANGNARGFDEVLNQLRTAFSDTAVESGKLTEEQRLQAISTLGLQRTGAAFLILANSTDEELEKLRGSFDRLKVTDLVDVLLRPLNAQMTIAWNNIQALSYAFGIEFVKALGAPARELVAFLQGLQTADMGGLAQQILTIGSNIRDAFGRAVQDVRDFFEAFGLSGAAIELARNALIGLAAIVATKITVAILSMIGTFGAFLGIVGVLTTAILKLMERLNEMGVTFPNIGQILDDIGKKLDELGAQWAPWAAEAGVAGEIVSNVLSGVHGLIQTLQFILQENFPAAAASSEGAMNNLALAAQGVYTALEPLITAFMAFGQFLAQHTEILIGVATAFLTLRAGLAIVAGVTALTTAWTAMTAAIAVSGGVIGAIVAVLGGPVTLVIAAIAIAVGLLTAAWIGNWGDIQGKTAAAIAFIQEHIETIRDVILAAVPIIGWLAIAWFRDLGGIQDKVKGFVDNVRAAFEALPQTLSDIGSSIQSGISSVGEAFSQLGTNVQSTISNIGNMFDGLGTTVRSALDGIGSTVGGFFSSLGSAVQAGLQAISDLFRATWNRIPEDIRNDLAIVSSLLVQRIGEWIQIKINMLGRMVEVASAAWNSVVTIVGNAMSMVGTVVSAGWATVTAAVGGAFSALGSQVQAGWTAVVQYTTQAMSMVASMVASGWNTVITTIGGAMSAIGTVVNEAWTGLLTIISSVLSQIVSAVTTWVGQVVGVLRTMVSQFAAIAGEAAEALINGLVNGITARAAAVGNAAATVARLALSAAKAALGAQSPSKEMEELGEDFDEGFEQGIEEKSYDVVAAAEDIVAKLETTMVARLEEAKRPIRGTAASLVDDLIREMYGILDQVDQLGIDMQAKMAQIGEDVGRKINETIVEAQRDIEELVRDTNRRIAEMVEDLGQSRSDRSRRANLSRDQDARRQARREKQEDEDAAAKRTRALADAEFEHQQDLADAENDEDRAKAEEKYQNKIQDIERDFRLDEEARMARRKRQREDADFERDLEKETQDLNDQLENEALARSIKRTEDERDARIKSINEAMEAKQQKIREQGQREIDELRENTLRKIDILEKDFAQKAADVLRKGGEQMRPLVDNIQNILSGNFDAMRKSAQDFTSQVENAIGALARLRQAAADAQFSAPSLPDPTEGLGESFPLTSVNEYQQGGVVKGPHGKPVLAVVHAGEYIAGLNTEAARILSMLDRRGPALGDTYNLNLNASYSTYESEANVEMDMRSMIALARG